jgi:hypothetical protein
MTRFDYLLVKLQEECAEVIQRVCKIQRFGIDEIQPEQPISRDNGSRLKDELRDLIAVLDMLEDEGFVLLGDPLLNGLVRGASEITSRRERIEKYIRYSMELNLLDVPPQPR